MQRATDHNNEIIALSIIGCNAVGEAHKPVARCYEALLEQAAKDGSYTAESTRASFDDAKTPFERCTALMSDVNNWAEEIYRRYSENATRLQQLFGVLRESPDSVSLVHALLEFEERGEWTETPTVQAAPPAEDPEDHAD